MKKKFRHKFVNRLLGPIVYRIFGKKFNYTHESCDLQPPFLVFANHTMDYDPFFIASNFKEHVYFVMSDHVSSLKPGKLIKHLVSPIPITKSSTDAETVKNVFSILRQGGIVGIFPEGNKSFSGANSWIKPSTVKLVRKSQVPLVIYNIVGGYFTSPRWSKIKRKGHVHSFIREIIYPEQIENMTDEELNKKIVDGLHVNAYEEQEKHKVEFLGENKAENIEALLYYCPKCGGFETIYGEGDHIKCKNCDLDGIYNNYGYIENAPFDRLDKWDEFQKQKLLDTNFDTLNDDDIITTGDNWDVQIKNTKYKSSSLGHYVSTLTKNNFILKSETDEIVIPISMIVGTAIEGTCSIQLSVKDGRVYRLKNELKTNGLKIVNLISRLNNQPYKF